MSSFIDSVKSGQLIVPKGSLARMLQQTVNPRRHITFFEKLVSRRKLNQSLAQYFAPREPKSSAPHSAVEQQASASPASGAPPPAKRRRGRRKRSAREALLSLLDNPELLQLMQQGAILPLPPASLAPSYSHSAPGVLLSAPAANSGLQSMPQLAIPIPSRPSGPLGGPAVQPPFLPASATASGSTHLHSNYATNMGHAPHFVLASGTPSSHTHDTSHGFPAFHAAPPNAAALPTSLPAHFPGQPAAQHAPAASRAPVHPIPAFSLPRHGATAISLHESHSVPASQPVALRS